MIIHISSLEDINDSIQNYIRKAVLFLKDLLIQRLERCFWENNVV